LFDTVVARSKDLAGGTMTKELNAALAVPMSRGVDAIGNIESIIGPGAGAVAQQAARQHVLVQEASKAIAAALGDLNFAVNEESFEFGGF
jgi:hypothetical protein